MKHRVGVVEDVLGGQAGGQAARAFLRDFERWDPFKDDFNSDNFSAGDFMGIRADSRGISGYKGYLGTPSGEFKIFDPETGKVSTLSE